MKNGIGVLILRVVFHDNIEKKEFLVSSA